MVQAEITGEVNVNFKSDYFPMEKMALMDRDAPVPPSLGSIGPPSRS